MKRKAPSSRRPTPSLKSQQLHNMEKGARIATEWALQEFQKVIEEAEAQAKAIVDKAKAIEKKAKKMKRKAQEVLQQARDDYQLIIEDAEDIAEGIIENAMQQSDQITIQNMNQNIIVDSVVIDLTLDDNEDEWLA